MWRLAWLHPSGVSLEGKQPPETCIFWDGSQWASESASSPLILHQQSAGLGNVRPLQQNPSGSSWGKKPCSWFPQLPKTLGGNDRYPQFFPILVSKVCPLVPCLAVGGVVPKAHEGQISGSEEAPFPCGAANDNRLREPIHCSQWKSSLHAVGRETSTTQEREFLTKSSAVIIRVHSQQVPLARDLDKYSVFPAHSVLKRGKLNCSLLAHTTGVCAEMKADCTLASLKRSLNHLY